MLAERRANIHAGSLLAANGPAGMNCGRFELAHFVLKWLQLVRIFTMVDSTLL
jgi:hypothetical protein